jgi:type IV secretion system protein VirB10
MRILLTLLVLSLSLSALTFAQSSSAPPANGASLPPAAAENSNVVVIPADTKVPIVLKQTISTKNTREGDAVYAETTFPVVVNDRIIIPAGTYVQGRISHIERAGRVKGRAEVLMHFSTLIYPSGYTVMLPGALQGAPGADKASVKDSEGTVREDGQTGEKVATAAERGIGGASGGAVIGGITTGSRAAAGIGAGLGGAVGVASALLKRGSDVKLEAGTTVEMVIQRQVTLDAGRIPR